MNFRPNRDQISFLRQRDKIHGNNAISDDGSQESQPPVKNSAWGLIWYVIIVFVILMLIASNK